MTILEKFVAYAERLPPEQRAELEARVVDLMVMQPKNWKLSPEQMTELERRMADPNPQYASEEEVEAFFARYRQA